jgi:hypothetical protein
MEFKQWLEANEMRAKISDKPAPYGPGVDRDWQNWILSLAGQWVDIDTDYVFPQSFNAIHPETGRVFHLPMKFVQDVENDVRPMVGKCSWCGATFKDVPDERIGEACPKCDAWPMQDLAVVDRLRPLVTVEKGKTKILNRSKRKIKTPEGDVYR